MQKYNDRILFVEDDADTADLVSTILKYAGCNAVVASTAAEAMQLAIGPRFQLILVEWSLENGVGPELCRKLKDYTSDTPVFLYTANTFRPDVKRAVEVGAEGCIDSPVGVAELSNYAHAQHRNPLSSPSSSSMARKTRRSSRLF